VVRKLNSGGGEVLGDAVATAWEESEGVEWSVGVILALREDV
jgi:hypothetical protein